MCSTLMNHNSGALELRSNYVSLPRHNGVYTGRTIPYSNVDATSTTTAIEGPYGRPIKLKDSLPYRLAGDCARMNAHAADHDRTVDNGDAFARLCGRDGALLSRWATSDHNKVIFG